MSVKTIKASVDKAQKDLEVIRVSHGSHEINEAIRNLNMASAYLTKEMSKQDAALASFLGDEDKEFEGVSEAFELGAETPETLA